MWYDLDPQFSAVVIGARGGVPYEEVSRERVSLEPIVIAVWPKVHALDAATARFDILNREQIRAQHKHLVLSKVPDMLETPKTTSTRPQVGSENEVDSTMGNQQGSTQVEFLRDSQGTRPSGRMVESEQRCKSLTNNKIQMEMAELEDEKVFNAIHYSSLSATDRNTLTSGSSGLSRGLLSTAFSYVEQYDAPVSNILMHAAQLRDIRNWTNQEFDPVNKMAADPELVYTNDRFRAEKLSYNGESLRKETTPSEGLIGATNCSSSVT